MLLKSIDFEISEFPGSCAVMVLSRLFGLRTTHRQAEEALASIKSTNSSVQRLPSWFSENPRSASRNIYSNAFAQPHLTMFGIVLASLLQEDADMTTLWCATDSYATTGDTEKGPFSTRNFIEWLQDRDLLSTIIESDKVLVRDMVGWFFTLNSTRCKAEVNRCTRRYERRYARLSTGCRLVEFRGTPSTLRDFRDGDW